MVSAGRVEKGMFGDVHGESAFRSFGRIEHHIEVKHLVRLIWASADDHPC
jgi:hypothetical protein